MALAKTMAVALFGLNGTLIDVEADISSNLPNFILVGLPDASLSEATSRVRAACTNSASVTESIAPAQRRTTMRVARLVRDFKDVTHG